MNIGKHLKTLREKNNLTQEQLADKLFVSRSNVSKWERNISLPDAETLLELSKIFNVSVDDILLGNNKNDSSGVLNIYKQIEKAVPYEQEQQYSVKKKKTSQKDKPEE